MLREAAVPIVLVASLSCLAGACRPEVAPAAAAVRGAPDRAPPGEPRRCVIDAIDVSAREIAPEECARWAADREPMVRQLGAGLRYILVGVHARTAELPPIATIDLPAAAKSGGRLQEHRVERQAEAARGRVRDAFAAACAAKRGPELTRATDIVTALPRLVSSTGCGPSVLLLESDLVHQTKELDLGRSKLTSASMSGAFLELAKAHRFKPGMLDGVDVRVVQRARSVAEGGVVNDAGTVADFFKLAASTLGAKVEIRSFYSWVAL